MNLVSIYTILCVLQAPKNYYHFVHYHHFDLFPLAASPAPPYPPLSTSFGRLNCPRRSSAPAPHAFHPGTNRGSGCCWDGRGRWYLIQGYCFGLDVAAITCLILEVLSHLVSNEIMTMITSYSSFLCLHHSYVNYSVAITTLAQTLGLATLLQDMPSINYSYWCLC